MKDNSEIVENIFSLLRKNTSSSLTDIFQDFNRGEVGVLSYLAFDNNEATAGELSEMLNVSTARIASILNSLESKEYIIRRADKTDKRKILVTITKKGIILATSAKDEIIKKISKVVKEIGNEKIKEYVKMMLKIKKILNE